MKLEPRHRLLICGKTQHGKTTWARGLLSANAKYFDRVLVFDVDEEYRPDPCKRALTVAQLEQRPQLLDAHRLLAVRPTGEDAHRRAMDCRSLLRMVRASGGKSLVLLEEPGRYARHVCKLCSDRSLPVLLETAATSWAKHGIAFVYVAQRAAQVPVTVRTQLSAVCSFRQDEPDDLEALKDRAGKDFAGAVASLGVGKFRLWRDDAPSNPQHESEQLQ